MRSPLYLLLVPLLLLAATLRAEEAKENTRLDSVVFIDGAIGTGEALPARSAAIAAAIRKLHPTATFAKEDETLLVGVPGLAGEFAIERDPTCSTDSQYFTPRQLASTFEPEVMAVIVAWTQHRHGREPSTPVREIATDDATAPENRERPGWRWRDVRLASRAHD